MSVRSLLDRCRYCIVSRIGVDLTRIGLDDGPVSSLDVGPPTDLDITQNICAPLLGNRGNRHRHYHHYRSSEEKVRNLTNSAVAARLRSSIRAISFGVFLVLIGAFFIIFPVIDEARAFVRDLSLRPIIDGIHVPLPTSPHPRFYHILSYFSAIWGAWLIIVLAIRIATRDNWREVIDTLSDSIFWFGIAFLLSQIEIEALQFRHIFAGIVVLIGIGIVIKALARILRKT